MKILSQKIVNSANRYLRNQQQDIAAYGQKVVDRVGVKKEFIQEFTPNRRLSRKPSGTNMSDPDWFLKEYESAVKQDLNLIVEWDNLSVEEKLDYIVKFRYRRLVANKIFNKIKNEGKEHHFLLGENGEIIAYDKGNVYSVKLKNCDKRFESTYDERKRLDDKSVRFAHIQAELPVLSIHNHPIEYDDILFDMEPNYRKIMEEAFGISKKSVIDPHSTTDVINCCLRQVNGAIVDQNGNKFFFYPVTFDKITEENLDKFIKESKNISKSKHKEYRKAIQKLNSYVKRKKQNEKEKNQLAINASIAYINKFKEIIQNNEYIEYLSSLFVKNNLGIFKF